MELGVERARAAVAVGIVATWRISYVGWRRVCGALQRRNEGSCPSATAQASAGEFRRLARCPGQHSTTRPRDHTAVRRSPDGPSLARCISACAIAPPYPQGAHARHALSQRTTTPEGQDAARRISIELLANQGIEYAHMRVAH